MSINNLSALAERINGLHEDIRAEVLVSDLLDSGVRIDEILVQFAGPLKRARNPDLEKVYIERYRDSREQLVFTLNRDSIYDTLPEGLFHQPFSAKREKNSVDEMVAEYRKHKHEEEQARLYFAPLENELFFQKTFTESEEYRQLKKLQQVILDAVILETFGIDPDLPRTFTSRLFKTLPYASEIAGNAERTGQLFSFLLNNPVSLQSETFTGPEKSESAKKLGEATLGFDLIAGETIVPDHFLMKLTIGPLSKKDSLIYLQDGWKPKALRALINFFVPVEWEIRIHIAVKPDQAAAFALNHKQTDGRLGYTTTLEKTA